jgi:hypothetical protein
MFYINLIKKLMKRKKRAPRKRSRSLSEGLSRKVGRKRISRRRSTSKKGILSEMFTPATTREAAKGIISGAVGGYAFGMVEPIINENIENPLARTGIALGLSFLTYSVLKMPNVSSGMAGAFGYSLSKRMSGLNEMNDTAFADDESLEEYPEYLDEMGEPVYLAADGTYQYMDEMNEDDMLDEMGEPVYLADPIYLAEDLYPEYVNVSNY